MHGKPHGRSHRKSHGRTNFSQYSHAQLYTMLHAGEERTVRSAADSWDGVGARLHEQASNLEAKLARFREQWQGGAAEQYQIMISDLSGGLRRIGDAAFAVRDAAHDSADALAKAKAEMPPPVEVPEVDPATVRLATATLTVDPMTSPDVVARLRQQQADAVAEVQAHQQVAQQASAAHAKAVAVMTELATAYHRADRAIPRVDGAEGPPGVPGSGAQDEVPGAGLGQEDLLPEDGGTDQTGQPKPVFGNMFTAGLAAASAAAAGRFGMPRIPPWVTGKKKDAAKQQTDEEKAKAAAGEVDKLAGAGLGGGGGGGVGKLGAAGIGGAPVPTAHGGMLGASPPPAAAAALGGIAAAGGAGAGAAANAMPMMPFMPFAPMGFDMAGARRVPPWLVETEEVWGESAIITPPVIGEDPPEEPNPPSGYRF